MARIKCINTGPRVRTITKATSSASAPSKRDRGRPWKRKRMMVLERDGYLCVECAKQGRVTPARDVDHVVPLHLGGSDNVENLQALCQECHAMKSADEEKERSNIARGY